MNHLKTFALIVACAAGSLTGCGGGDSDGPPPVYTTQILSDPAFDGDIFEPAPNTDPVTQGMSATVQSIFAGIDPADGTEYRAFLDFPLGGAGGVPANAIIESAFLDVNLNSLQPTTAVVPIRVELVSFQPPTLVETDFDRSLQPPLAYVVVTPAFNQSDVGNNTSIDVTSLMVQAQQLGLVDFQLRILEDLGPPIPGLIEINDSTGSNRAVLAPQLTVSYF